MALALYNEALVDTERTGVEVFGEGASELSTDERNHCVWAMRELARRCGRELPPARLELHNRIPVGRGLASSGAAVLAGLMLANELLDRPCTRRDVMDLGTEIEGHPDNVAAAILGGVVVSVWDGRTVEAVRLAPPPEMRAVVWTPEASLATKQARAALPEYVPMGDAVFNLGHAALFAAAFATGQWEHLRAGVRDRLHQPYRAPLVRGLNEIMEAALDAGALASCLSGAGPSVLAICNGDTEGVERAMLAVGTAHAGAGRVLVLAVDEEGATAQVEA